MIEFSAASGVDAFHIPLGIQEEGALLGIAAAGAVGDVKVDVAVGHGQTILLSHLQAEILDGAAVAGNAVIFRDEVAIRADLG